MAESSPRLDTLAFQVDLWSARGELPRTMAEVATRHKEIQYSSRTRAGTDTFKHIQRIRRALADLHDKLPEELRHTPEARFLQPIADRKVYNLVHLIYRAKIPRITISPGPACASTGALVTTTRFARYATPRCSSARETMRECPSSIWRKTAANETGR